MGLKEPTDYDPYEILGIENNASDADINKAYRKLVIKLHPDKLIDLPEEEKAESEELFHKVQYSKQYLLEKNERFRKHGLLDEDDKKKKEEPKPKPTPPPAAAAAPAPKPPPKPKPAPPPPPSPVKKKASFDETAAEEEKKRQKEEKKKKKQQEDERKRKEEERKRKEEERKRKEEEDRLRSAEERLKREEAEMSLSRNKSKKNIVQEEKKKMEQIDKKQQKLEKELEIKAEKLRKEKEEEAKKEEIRQQKLKERQEKEAERKAKQEEKERELEEKRREKEEEKQRQLEEKQRKLEEKQEQQATKQKKPTPTTTSSNTNGNIHENPPPRESCLKRYIGLKDGINQRTIDVKQSFGPFSCTILISKLFIATWIIATFCYAIIGLEDSHHLWFIFSTNWGLTLAVIYIIFSVINTLLPLAQPDDFYPPGSYIIYSYIVLVWILFYLAIFNSFMVFVLYWALDFPEKLSSGAVASYGPRQWYLAIFSHSMSFILLFIDGFIINRIPIRLKHFPIVVIWTFIYFVWSYVHAGTDIGNPFRDDSDLLYNVIDWNNNGKKTLIISAIITLVGAPTLFFILWFASIFSCGCPCSCNGSNRRYIEEKPRRGSNFNDMA